MTKTKTKKRTAPATSQMLTLRVHPEIFERADELIAPLANDAELAIRLGGRISRADVIRLALLEGIKTLERKHRS